MPPIINPSLDSDCWKRFEFDADGDIKVKDENDEKAKKTIEILNLKAIPLKEKRKKAWLLAREKFSNEEEYDLISAEAIRACWVQELNETYHLCVVHRAWFLKNYAQVLNA